MVMMAFQTEWQERMRAHLEPGGLLDPVEMKKRLDSFYDLMIHDNHIELTSQMSIFSIARMERCYNSFVSFFTARKNFLLTVLPPYKGSPLSLPLPIRSSCWQ